MQHRLVPLRQSVIGDDSGQPARFGAVVAGSPAESCITVFDGGNERFSCGVWQCTAGTVEMKDWPYDEFCVLLAGRVIITPQGGAPLEFRQGDAFAIPKGFSGTWDIRETVRKYYAIQKHPGRLASLKQAVRGLLSL